MKLMLGLIFSAFFIQVTSAQEYPEGFQIETVVSNVEFPAGIAHSEMGISYIWDLQGIVWPMINDQRADLPLVDISEEVGFWNDHGLLSVALDPDFASNGFIYLYYVVDRHYLFHFGTPEYDATANQYEEATIGRLTRYQVDIENPTTLLNAERHIIVGTTKETGIPIATTSHGVGTVLFGSDKSLLLSAGDSNAPGSTYNGVGTPPDGAYDLQALEDGIIKLEENVGAFRSQFLNSYCGKVLRMDKATGLGLPSNPFYDEERPAEPVSKVWALGLRNPFRMTMVPQTGSTDITEGYPGDIIVGDVGDWSWEEINLVNSPRMNFGWPIYQGPEAYWNFNVHYTEDVTRPLESDCPQGFLYFQDVLVDPKQNGNEIWSHPCGGQLTQGDNDLFVHERPILTYRNWVSTPPEMAAIPTFNSQGNPTHTSLTELDIEGGIDFYGAASVAGTFYVGAAYPEEYYHSYFHADFARWLKVMHYNDQNELVKVEHWDNDIGNVVDVSLNPNNECIYVVTLFPSEVKKISFEGNLRPVAELTPDTTFGAGPVTVSFDASSSYDPEGTELIFAWDFGDGIVSDQAIVSHTFSNSDNAPEAFIVSLEVTDGDGLSNSVEALVSINNTPPNAEIISIADDFLYSINETTELLLEALLFDEQSEMNDLDVQWRVFLHHNSHFHLEQTYNQHIASNVIQPLGCGIETFWYRIQLTVSDPQGLTVVQEREIFPDCDSSGEYPNEFVLYPNPASFNVVVQFNQFPGDWVEFEIYDPMGRHVKSEYLSLEIDQKDAKISISDLSEGGYILICRTAFWEKKRRFIVIRQ